MTSTYAYGESGRRGSRRTFKLLAQQNNQCSECKCPINNGNYFDFKNKLTCGTCALKIRA